MREVARPAGWMREVDRFRAALPEPLESSLAPVYGMVGRIGEYFLGDDEGVPPVLDYHEWLLADLAEPGGAVEDAARARLFTIGYFLLAAHHATRSLQVGAPGCGPEYAVMAALLQRAADAGLARLLPPDSPGWTTIGQAGAQAATAMLALRQHARGEADAGWPAALSSGGQWAGFVALSLVAAHLCGRDAMRPALAELVARMNAVWQGYADLLNVRRDAEQGMPSVAIYRLHGQTGWPLRCDGQQTLAALLASGCAEAIVADLNAEATAAATMARGLGLQAVGTHIDALVTELRPMGQALRAARMATSGVAVGPRPARAGPAREQAALERARDYLLDDMSMREAWDVYRTGFLGEPVRTGRPFPVGFVLENLAATGVPLREPIADVLRLYLDNRGDYFDGQGRLAREIDTWGLMLRLARRVPVDAALADLLWQPLHAVAVALERDGDIPVWVMDTAPPGAQQRLYGMHCTACQAHLLLALAMHDVPIGNELLRTGVSRLAATLEATDTGGAVFYGPRYLAWMVRQLVAALTRGPGPQTVALAEGRLRLSAALDVLLARIGASGIATPQQAALSILAAAAQGPARDACVDLLLREQRPDGGWNAEALYWAPTQQHPGYWYASRLATSSLCHRALAQREE